MEPSENKKCTHNKLFNIAMENDPFINDFPSNKPPFIGDMKKGSSSWVPGAPGLLQGGLPSGEAWRKGGI